MSKEVKVGILVLVSGVLMYFGYHFLKGNDLLSNESVYQVRFAKIDGLQVSSSVLVNGHRIGQVEDIEIEHEKNDSLLIFIRVKSDVKVGDSTVATLLAGNPLGGQTIKLDLGHSTTLYEGGELLTPVVEVGIMAQIQGQIETLKLVGEKVAVITDKNGHLARKMRNILDNVDKTTKNSGELLQNLNISYSRQQKSVETIIQNFKYISTEFKSLPDSLKIAISETSTLLDSLNNVEYVKLANDLDSVMINMQTITAQLIDSNNTVGALLNEKEMYNNLNKTIKDLDFVLVDFQANPSKYTSISVFGKQPDNEKSIIKSIGPKSITTQLELQLKREIPAQFNVNLYDLDNRNVIELLEKTYTLNRSKKTISIPLPSTLAKGEYVLHAVWLGASSGQSITIEVE